MEEIKLNNTTMSFKEIKTDFNSLPLLEKLEILTNGTGKVDILYCREKPHIYPSWGWLQYAQDFSITDINKELIILCKEYSSDYNFYIYQLNNPLFLNTSYKTKEYYIGRKFYKYKDLILNLHFYIHTKYIKSFKVHNKSLIENVYDGFVINNNNLNWRKFQNNSGNYIKDILLRVLFLYRLCEFYDFDFSEVYKNFLDVITKKIRKCDKLLFIKELNNSFIELSQYNEYYTNIFIRNVYVDKIKEVDKIYVFDENLTFLPKK